MEYIKKVSQIVDNYRNAIATEQAEYAEWKKSNGKNSKYSDDYKKKKAAEYENAIAAAKNQGIKALNDALTLFAGEQQSADVLDATKLTEDIKLLESNFALPKETLQAIFDKNSGNRTMQQLTLFRAQKDGILLERIFYSAQKIIAAARDYSYWASRAMTDDDFYSRAWTDEKMNAQMVPDELRGIE